jgi:LPS sulfotransferase NodH
MFHEIFADHNRQLGTNFDQIISSLYGKKEKRVKQVGVKIFYYRLTENEWAKFMTHNEFKIIHLVRLNRLRTIISLEIALKTDQWVATPFSNRHPKDKSVSIDTSTLIEQIEKIDYFEKITRERFKDLQFLEVAYEDITGNPQDEFKKIESFLSLRNIDPGAIRHKKQNPESLRDLISNYDEVEQVLIGTPHEIYLKNNLTT